MKKEVKEKYNQYPPVAKKFLHHLRELIIEVIDNNEEIDFIGEDLKWSEPSFITKSSGSTIRIDWKEKQPNSVSLYFNCKTKLISIFKDMYPSDFEYINNREIRLPLKKTFDEEKLKKCIEIALKYNLLKSKYL